MIRICALFSLLMLVTTTGCIRRNLAPTFAKTYKNIMAAQIEGRSSRALAPMRGDEAKRIVKAYYGTLGEAGADASASGGGSTIMSGQTPPGPANGAGGNPFAFKVR